MAPRSPQSLCAGTRPCGPQTRSVKTRHANPHQTAAGFAPGRRSLNHGPGSEASDSHK
jgi:hypothetical protein